MDANKNIDEVLLSPLFIVGASRSGTTWLQRMFLSHPAVIGDQESHFFVAFTPAMKSAERPLKQELRNGGLASYWDERNFYDEVLLLWKKTFSPLMAGCEDVRLLVEKSPEHCLHMDSIKKILPNARFIHVIRDSRAVVASMLAASRGWGRHWAPANARDAAVKWRLSVSTGRSDGACMKADEYTEVHYESLLGDTMKELRRLWDFAGLPYDEALLEQVVDANRFNKQKESTESDFVTNLGGMLFEPKGFHRKGKADSWKTDLSLMEKLTVWRYTHRLMHECGYAWRGYIDGKSTRKTC